MNCKVLIRVAVLTTVLLSGTACTAVNSVRNTFFGGSNATAPEQVRLEGFIGAVVADEPRAALAGREALVLGGSAADAAVAVAFTLSVTLPSRASLGGGGGCLAYTPDRDGPGRGMPEAVLFTPLAPSSSAGGDRPAAIPMLPRGLFALHARYGRKPFESLLAGPEQMARFGVPISRALVRDLAVVAGPLMQDPNAKAIFAPSGQPLNEGGTLQQPDLGATLSALRTAGVGDLYQGGLARRLETASRLAGGPLLVADMRGALPRTGAPITLRAGNDSVAFLPPPADGGLGAAAAFQALQADAADMSGARARAAAAVQRWRSGGGDPMGILAASLTGGALPALPASTSFVVLDREGGAVACALTMNNLFGTGRVAPGTGIVLAASPQAVPPPLLAAAIAWNANVRGFRAAVGGSGQDGAALAVAAAMTNTLRSAAAMPAPVPEPGRANVIACSRYLPGRESACAFATDPRGSGLAAASN